jgi:hypothetical protein
MAARAGPHEIPITPQKRGSCDANIKRLERGTFRMPAAGAQSVEMTTAGLAALLAGIDLDTARRRVRYSWPNSPPQNSEKIAPTTEYALT